MTDSANPRGRPQAASRELLQDAALELFLENGYAGTTIEQITTRAGVSRNTFFNYFDAKSDVFWVELDDALERIPASLSTAPTATGGIRAVEAALLEFGSQFGPERVPFALTQYELIGSVNELQASALTRFTRQAALLADFLTSRGFERLRAQTAAYAALGAVVAAGQAWADAGTARGDLLPYLSAALSPVIGAFAGE